MRRFVPLTVLLLALMWLGPPSAVSQVNGPSCGAAPQPACTATVTGTVAVTGTTSNASSGVATSSTNLPSVAYNYGFNGTTWDQLQVDASKFLKVILQTGSAIIGRVGFDQTTPGTTNAVSIAQIGANTVGTAASGVQKVGIVGNAGAAFDAATAAAPPANVVAVGANASGATGGLMKGLITCDLHAKYDASDNGSITLVTGVSGRKVYVCGYLMATGGTATNLKLREGSDANCATNAADLTPAYQLTANNSIGFSSPFWTGLGVSTNAYYICINASAGNAHQAELWYTIL